MKLKVPQFGYHVTYNSEVIALATGAGLYLSDMHSERSLMMMSGLGTHICICEAFSSALFILDQALQSLLTQTGARRSTSATLKPKSESSSMTCPQAGDEFSLIQEEPTTAREWQ